MNTTVRPERQRPRAMHLVHSLTLARPRAEVFRFLTQRVPAHYRELARGHERYEVLGGGPVREGVSIDCRERVSNQEVHHLYRVIALERDRHLYLASTPTKTFIHLPHRVIADEADTHVYYDLTDRAEGTQLEMTIVIQMRKLATKWLALATGSAGLWRRHQREELGALKQLVESEPPVALSPASA